MKATGYFGLLYCLFNSGDARLKWSDSYILKAVLTVPAADLNEPYQVWVNGETKNSRVDFYNGMDKMYHQWNGLTKKFEYYKIHPETAMNDTIVDVCNRVDGTLEILTYARNTYLPVVDLRFKNKEKINGIETEKWQVVYAVDRTLDINVTHTMWVTFTKSSNGEKTPIPIRYVYGMSIGNITLDYFRHDYSSFEEVKPDKAIVTIPSEMKCEPLEVSSDEAVDPLLEYVDPKLEHLRVRKVFDSFKKRHNKNYESKIDHIRRLNIFKNNLRYINSINRQHRSFSTAVNHLADLTDKEMLVFMGTLHSIRDIVTVNRHHSDIDNDYDDNYNDIDGDNVNLSFDWREFGAVTAVKDQTTLCGSCYAFTTAAAVESAAYVARGCKHLTEMSEQAIVDCSWGDGTATGGNFGCGGGTYEYTLKWLKENGLPTKEEYGLYLALEGRCHIKNMTKLATIKSYEQLPKKKQVIKDSLRKHGPLLIAINTTPRSFFFYTSGVYNDPQCEKDPNKRTHGVTLVGYGKDGDQGYWIIKNSFGAQWGESGYMRLAIKDNVCGVKNFAYSVGFKKSQVEKCVKK